MSGPSPELTALWEEVRKLEKPALLAASVLRRLESEAHKKRDRKLSETARSFLNRKIPDLLPELSAWLRTSPETLPNLPPLDPDTLSGSSLFRPDRQWERHLVTEAKTQGWEIRSFRYSFNPENASQFHSNLEEKTWPNALILWVETDPHSPPERGLWHGQWWIAYDPGFQSELAKFFTIH